MPHPKGNLLRAKSNLQRKKMIEDSINDEVTQVTRYFEESPSKNKKGESTERPLLEKSVFDGPYADLNLVKVNRPSSAAAFNKKEKSKSATVVSLFKDI